MTLWISTLITGLRGRPGYCSGEAPFWKNLAGVSFSPALLHVLGVAVGAELHAGGVHDDVAERHADHVVVVDGAHADALQVRQRHQQVLAAHRAAVGVLPVILPRETGDFTDCDASFLLELLIIGGKVKVFRRTTLRDAAATKSTPILLVMHFSDNAEIVHAESKTAQTRPPPKVEAQQ